MVHYRRGVALSPDRGWPKRLVNEQTTPPVHIQDGSGWGQVPPLGWREWDIVEGDQRHKQQWKRWTVLRWRYASPGSLSVGEQLVGLPNIGVMRTVRGAQTTSWAAVLDCLTCANEGIRKTSPGGWYHWEYKVAPWPWNNFKILK